MRRFISAAPSVTRGVWPIAAILASAMCAFLFMATPANAATSEGAVISNGTVQLGVNAQGDLNYDCVGAGDTECPDPSAGSGEQIVGLRYVPLNLDAISPGCQCEGWGLADAGSGLTGSANESAGDSNITIDSFNATATTSTSTVTISDPLIPGSEMEIVQFYHPSPLSPNLYVDTVTVTNTGANTLTDLRYRRAMDWDIEPTAFEEWVTIQGTSPQLLFDSDDGFASSDPLSGPSYIASESVCGASYTGACQFTDLGSDGTYPTASGPEDHGALFDFGLGQLGVGESRSFNVYYGAADGETAATSALQAGGAQVYSLGESNCSGDTIATCSDPGGNAGVELGKPATFAFGFVTTIGDLSITKADSPDPVQVNNNLTYTITVNNNGPQAAAGVQVTDPLPAGVNLVSATPDQGSCSGTSTVTCDLGSIANAGDAQITIVVTPTSVGSGTLSNTATVSSASSDGNSSNNQDTETTTVLPEDAISPTVTLTNPANGSTTADNTPTYDGTAGTAVGDLNTVTVKIYAGATATGSPVQTLSTTQSGGSWTVDGSPALADGTYTAQAEQSDSAGNTGQSAPNTFTIDTPPDTIIDSAAHGTTSDTTPSFAFHSTEAGSTFECSIDTGTASFGPCSGPGATHTPASPLTDGAYTFRVRATDSDGTANTDASPATEAFTIDVRHHPTRSSTRPRTGRPATPPRASPSTPPRRARPSNARSTRGPPTSAPARARARLTRRRAR